MADRVDTVDMAERRPGRLNPRFLTLTAITLTAAAAHALPHPPNFSPLYAMALFGGAYFGNRAIALLLPVTALLLGDVALGMFVYGRDVWAVMPFVYPSFVLTALIGMWVQRQRRSPVAIAVAVLASSIAFFLITNFGAWVAFDFYPRTLDGLIECYIVGLLQFRNTLLSNALFTLVLFGGFALAQRLIASLREPVPAVALSQRSSP